MSNPPPADNSQTAAWILANQQAMEAAKPIVITSEQSAPPLGTPPQQSQHPDWVNICPECNAQVNWTCVGPTGNPLNYIHGPRQVLNGA